MKVNIKTISEMTGFSLATVSNALHNKRGVNKETMEKVLAAAREIGYLSDIRINQVKLVVYKETGQVVGDSPFFYTLFSGIGEECRKNELTMTMCTLSRAEEDYETRLSELLHDPSSALLILATELEPEEAGRFTQAMSPVVMLDNWYEDLPFSSIAIDNEEASARAVRELIRKGHRKIGYLKGSFGIHNFRLRGKGYRNALAEAGLAYREEFTFCLTPSMEGAYRDMQAILQTEPDLPTAFFADNDMIALGALRAFKQNGYKIPEDISIVGFDDLPFCSISDPPLSTIHVFNDPMGRTAVRRLIDEIRDPQAVQTKTLIKSQYVERESICDIK